jgi:hypothetical protein
MGSRKNFLIFHVSRKAIVPAGIKFIKSADCRNSIIRKYRREPPKL